MTPTKEQALTAIRLKWAQEDSEGDFYEDIFMAGYALGAQERQAQDARICKELSEHVPAEEQG